MSWWRRFWAGKTEPCAERLQRVRFTMQGWHDEGTRGEMHGWRDSQGDFIALVVTPQAVGLAGLAELSDEVALQQSSRNLAESRGGGLIEVRLSTGALGPTSSVIYKRRLGSGYTFTGMLFAPGAEPPQLWSIVTQERGMTGVREAIITAELLNAGSMTMQDYQRSWAKDPYDADYHGVDRSVLRFVSDDESYDERFPEHPLTKVRWLLKVLPGSVIVTSAEGESRIS